MTPEEISKLSKKAQSYIRTLESSIETLQRSTDQLYFDQEESRIWVETGFGFEDDRRKFLSERHGVTFNLQEKGTTFDKSGKDRNNTVQVALVPFKDTTALEIRGWEGLQVHPRASNSLYITTER